MAREFDDLESESRPRPGRLQPVDPSVDTFRRRFAPFSSDPMGDQIEDALRRDQGRPVRPGTRERFGDPTKVIAGAIPTAEPPLPEGFSYVDVPEQKLPTGFEYVDVPVSGNKVERFLKNLTPGGPISGAIALARTAGQAAQGARPDLLTNPENAIPEAVQGGIADRSEAL